MTFFYFAYGSNMLPSRLLDRCSSARLVGTAVARGYEIEFSKPSIDGSGKATLAERAGALTPGSIFEISLKQRAVLDGFEGKGYTRNDTFTVEEADSGKTFEASTYLANEVQTQLVPYDWYLALIIAGAKFHDFSPDYVERLRSTKFDVDEKTSRNTRESAIIALKSNGFPDLRALFQR